ncbi:hypothetical protein ACHABX_13530 [Nesterenkonia halotolerans]|uniref:hypothetical protein n=1 Tax=Nesterenkonia halotolerans TaxID=225325 RepID=UPI003EE4FD72
MNTMNPGPGPADDAEFGPGDESVPEDQSAAFSEPPARPKRQPPKSPAVRLAEIEARAEVLRTKVEAHRLNLRAELVEDLYNKYEIASIKGDIDESQRMAKLRETLWL